MNSTTYVIINLYSNYRQNSIKMSSLSPVWLTLPGLPFRLFSGLASRLSLTDFAFLQTLVTCFFGEFLWTMLFGLDGNPRLFGTCFVLHFVLFGGLLWKMGIQELLELFEEFVDNFCLAKFLAELEWKKFLFEKYFWCLFHS